MIRRDIFKKQLALYALMSFAALFNPVYAQEAPVGEPVTPSKAEEKALAEIKGTISGVIVWSTSRSNSKHDIWKMNADGTEPTQLTKTDQVDWFPRISPDGQTILFNRSKGGWVSENDAKYFQKWDLYMINMDGTGERKVVDGATWGTWRPNGKEIVFSRDDKVFIKSLDSAGTETLLLDGSVSIKKGTIVQEPNLSPDGNYLAATLRGTSRETGIWNLAEKKWVTTGEGCQIDWFPDGKNIYRMNSTGNGGSAAPSEVLKFEVKNGVPTQTVGAFSVSKDLKLMDLPGRRSHEYFPKVDASGRYMVWCATQKGHDHDIYDYEMYLWKIGEKAEKAVRLTFHTGNDRWPDIYIKQ